MIRKLWIILFGTISLSAVDHVDPKYQIFYGSQEADISAIEYFSLSCPKCYAFFKKEFPKIREAFIDNNRIFWAFHPDPADLLTLQAMVCLEKLPQEKRRLFFESLIECVMEQKGRHGCELMQMAMDILGFPVPQLDSIEFLQTTDAFQEALQFLMQKDGVEEIPALEINGHMYVETPTYQLVKRLF